MDISRYIYTKNYNIVFIGDFNPKIFHPTWLSSKRLIRDEEAENANVEIIHSEIARFSIEDWVAFDIRRDRCTIWAMKISHFDVVRDLIYGVFNYLPETPINFLGINHRYEVDIQSSENYYEFGNKLAPLTNWNNKLKEPRLFSLEILENNSSGYDNKSKRINISPSELKELPYGVRININHHFSLKQSNGIKAVTLFNSEYEKTDSESLELISNILDKTILKDG